MTEMHWQRLVILTGITASVFIHGIVLWVKFYMVLFG